jgi:hypothetical protein
MSLGLGASPWFAAVHRRGGPSALALLAATGALPAWLSHSRAGGAMMFDSTGKLTWAPENLLTNSKWIGGTAGTLGSGAVAPTDYTFGVNTGSVSYPAALNGDGTAVRFVASAQRPYIQQSISVTANTRYIKSFYVDAVASGLPVLTDIAFNATPSGTTAYYVDGVSVPGSTAVSAGTRVAVVFDIGATGGSTTFRFGLGANGNVTGDVTLSAPQLERVTYQTTPRTYNATTSAAYYGPRFDYDPATLDALGYLNEGTRTNAFISSRDLTAGQYLKINSTALKNQTGIDGVTNSASSLTTTATYGFAAQSVALASSARAQSVYLKRLVGTSEVRMSQGELTGAELVTNGDFPSATTGWTGSGATLSIDTGRLKVTNDAAAQGYGYQAITTVVGRHYSVTLSGEAGTSATTRIRIGTTIGGAELRDIALLGVGTRVFVATTTTTYISLGPSSSVAGEYSLFDDVSVKELASVALSVTDTVNWSRFSIPTKTIANPTFMLSVADSGDSIAVDFVQNENGTFASSPIWTTTAAATRASDVVQFTGVSLATFNANYGAMIIQAQMELGDGVSYYPRLVSASTSSVSLFFQGATVAATYNGTRQLNSTTNLSTIKRAAVAWDKVTPGTRIQITGVALVSDANQAMSGSETAFYLGSAGGSSNFMFGHVQSLALYNKNLSDAEIAAKLTVDGSY